MAVGAYVATIIHVLAAWHRGVDLGADFLGFVHLPSMIVLSLCSIVGVELAVRALPRIADKAHAITYVGLLILVVVTMLL